jgi:hypothetical protein
MQALRLPLERRFPHPRLRNRSAIQLRLGLTDLEGAAATTTPVLQLRLSAIFTSSAKGLACFLGGQLGLLKSA